MGAFQDLIAKTHARWTTLVEMGLGKEQGLWINETVGIWQAPIGEDWSNLPVLLGFDMPEGETAAGKPIVPDIETVLQGLEFLTEQGSYANMISTNKSWYYDPAKETIYVHCDSYKDPDIYQMILGTTFYAADRAVDLDGHYWEPCIVGTPVIELTRDPLLYGVMAFDGGSVVLDNHGGRLDSLKDYFLYGQPILVKFGGDDLAYADYRTCFRGYILNADLGEEEIRIDGIDKRYELGITLPVNRFSNATYSDINTKNVGKSIPLAWGPCRNVPCVCTNENAAAPGNYTFKVADVVDHPGGIRGISAAYVNGESKAISSYDLIGGTFNVAAANYAPGRTVTADVVGFGTRNIIARADCENSTPPSVLDETSCNLTNAIFERSADRNYSGNYSYKTTKNIAAGTASYVRFQDTDGSSDMHGMSANSMYTASIYLYVPSGNIQLSEIALSIYDYAGGWAGNSVNPTQYDQWERITVTRTTRANCTGFAIQLDIASAASINEYFYVDNVQLEHGNNATDWILREDAKVTKTLGVIEDIVDTYTDIAYNATYFDTTPWEAAKNNAVDIGLWVGEEKTVSDIIAEIAKSWASNFLAKDSGLYTWKKFTSGGNASWAPELREIENPASSDQDYDNYLTSVHIKYNRDWSANAGTIESKEDLAAGIYQKYGQYRSYELDTLLTTEADAEELAAWLMDYMKDSRQIIENTLPVKYIETEIGDIVDLNGDRPDKSWMGLIRCEVIGVKKQLGDEPKVTVMGREVPE